MKYLNIYIFIALSLIYFLFSSQIKFSTNFLEVFFSKESIKLFQIAKKFGYSDEILISKKGFKDKSLDELYQIANRLKSLKEISKVEISKAPSKALEKYIQKNYYILSEFDNTKLTNKEIKQKLKILYEDVYNSVIYTPLNPYDPLGLFSFKESSNDYYYKLKDYGYVLKAKTNIDTADATQTKEVYNKVNQILKGYSDILVFAPFFYLVENSSYIRSDAQTIMLVATIFLLILYFLILKNYKLFFNSVITIANSILSAILVTYFFFGNISILALVFGISITTISIDYMFHYYFHNDFSKKKFIINKSVLFGFITTFGVFVIFTFIDIELFSQLALFSVVSLFVAYMLFSWVFVYLEIPAVSMSKNPIKDPNIKHIYIVVISVFMLIYSYKNLSFDTNLKNLDYQNTKLLDISERFKKGMGTDRYQSLILSAKSEQMLLKKYENLLKLYPDMVGVGKFVYSKERCYKKLEELNNYDFKRLKNLIKVYSKEVGFGEGLNQAYKGVESIKCDMHLLDDMKFKIIKDNNIYYTMAFIPKDMLIKESDGVSVIDLAKTLKKDTQDMKNTLLKYIVISIVFILFTLLVVAGLEFLYPLVYLVFPISSVLFFISIYTQINIMHMFALIILIAIGIDYGIYMYKTDNIIQTRKAIGYALLSTFCGFGVLIFSNTMALYSIGFVITVGIGAIFILLYTK